MPFQPAIDEPSNILPSSKNASSTTCAGRHVVLFAARVGEAQVDEFDLLFLHELESVGYRHWISSVFFIRESF